MTMLSTPLSLWHQAQGAKMAPFAGWNMPIHYTGIIQEHEHTRRHVSVFDICHMGEFLVSGKGATDALARAITTNLRTLAPGRCRYGFLLNEAGGILDDLITYRLAEDAYMLVVNAACIGQDRDKLAERLPSGIRLEDISARTGKIDLQGPAALEVLTTLFPDDTTNWRGLTYYSFVEIIQAGTKILVSRTGYTGELGYEIYLPAADTLNQWERCLCHPLVKPAGLGARDTLRLEAGLLLNGQDMDPDHTPAEAGYAGLLSSTDIYTGKAGAPLVRRKITALRLKGRRSARHGNAVLLPGDERTVGIVTSASFAPSLGYAVALAYIDAPDAEQDNYLIRAERTCLEAERVDLPFYKEGTATKKLV